MKTNYIHRSGTPEKPILGKIHIAVQESAAGITCEFSASKLISNLF